LRKLHPHETRCDIFLPNQLCRSKGQWHLYLWFLLWLQSERESIPEQYLLQLPVQEHPPECDDDCLTEHNVSRHLPNRLCAMLFEWNDGPVRSGKPHSSAHVRFSPDAYRG